MRALRLPALVPFVLARSSIAASSPCRSSHRHAAPAADATPTELTPEQKARDDVRRLLAEAITGAYSNYEGKGLGLTPTGSMETPTVAC